MDAVMFEFVYLCIVDMSPVVTNLISLNIMLKAISKGRFSLMTQIKNLD